MGAAKDMGSEVLEMMFSIPIKDFQMNFVMCVDETNSLASTISMMKNSKIGSTLIIKDNALTGIFTERDIFTKIIGNDIDLENTPVMDYMTKNPISLKPESTLKDVVDCMQKGQFRHVPIVNKNNEPVSIISIKDVLDYLVPSVDYVPI